MEASLRFVGERLVDERGEDREWPRLAVIGDPIGHSLSPTLHEAALRHHGLEDRYGRIQVASADLQRFLDASGRKGMRGLNLTMPHKRAPLELDVRCAEEVQRIGAANTLVRRGEEWVAHNTDARGFALALQRWLGRDLESHLREVLILGAGGAARAIHAALVDLGAARVRIAARDVAKASWAASGTVEVETLGGLRLRDARLVVQCTPLGWEREDPSPVAAGQWRPSMVAFDLVYARDGRSTRFLADAQAAGVRCQDGLGMLVAQAALAFTMWYGGDSPLAPMAASVGIDW